MALFFYLFGENGVAFDVYYDSHSAASNQGYQTWEALFNARFRKMITEAQDVLVIHMYGEEAHQVPALTALHKNVRMHIKIEEYYCIQTE